MNTEINEQMALSEYESLLRVMVLLQATLHKLDDLSGAKYYRQSLKNQTNRYLNFIEGRVEQLTKTFEIKEGEMYVDIVNDIEKIVDTINVVKE